MARMMKKVAVIGSGVMGSGIAAHVANVGLPTLLVDIVPTVLTKEEQAKGFTLESSQVRNRLAANAKQKLLKQKPAPLMSKENLQLIEIGNLEDDLDKLQDCDWIIEVVVERLDIKKAVLEKVDANRKQGSIITSNTSGISIEAMAEGRSADFKRHFLGTHFFNPPRYLKLVEVIPTRDTAPDVTQFMKGFLEETLGKGVVLAKDTPNFIANRIGTYGLLVTVREMLKGGYSVGEVDSITGQLIGRPKSATFRTLDVVGLDTFAHVANNVYGQVEGNEKRVFDLPPFMKTMIEKGWLGSKSGQGFYLKKGKDIHELNLETLEYEPRKKLRTQATQRSKQTKDTHEKLRALVYADDRAGAFLWKIIKPVLLYSAQLIGEIADDIVSIDEAMRWGFGWEQGPFELWDALGVKTSVQKMEQEGEDIPTWINDLLRAEHSSFYNEDKNAITYYDNGERIELQENPKIIHLNLLKNHLGVIKKNSGASLLEIGEDVAALQFHSPNQAIGMDIIQMLNFAVDEVEKNYKGLVISHDGKNFCVGANLAMILMEAQDDNYFEIDLVVRQFQNAMMKVKYSSRPIVAAPFGMTLGGGVEVCLPAAALQAASETYMGLVETGVGVIPGGGGNKELYLRQLESHSKGVKPDLHKAAAHTFETIAMAKVSTSAQEALETGYLRPQDGISFNRDYLLYDAKQTVLGLVNKGYRPPQRKKIPVVGEAGYATMLLGALNLKNSGYISDHDMKIAEKLAFVIAGGRVAEGTLVDEQYLLDLEREAFLSLVAEPKTQQRMQHMLMKGKPLRN